MMFIFEDKASMPVSKLLTAGSPYPCKFTAKNDRLKSFLKRLDTESEGVMFVDVNPLNSSSVILFTQLRNELKKYKNMLLIPIVCIEEHVFKMLRCVKGAETLFDFESILETRNHSLYVGEQSLEVSLKSILGADTGKFYCLKNRCTNRSIHAGVFYKQSCSASCPAAKDFGSCPMTNLPLPLEFKSLLLWFNMPIMFSYDGCEQFDTLTQLTERISAERIDYYTKICNSLGIKVPKWVSNINVYPFSISDT